MPPFTHDVPRYPRKADGEIDLPRRPDGKPLRLTIVYTVVYRFRIPLYRRLHRHPALKLKLLVGPGMPGDKAVNAPDLSGLPVTKTFAFRKLISNGGRSVPLFFNPTHIFHLIAQRPDVIITQGGEAINNLFVLLYAKLFRKPLVWWTLGALRGRTYSKIGMLHRRIVLWIERRATTYLGYSSSAMQHFESMGYPMDRCFNLVNVVDTDLVKENIEATRDEVEPLRDRLGLRDKRVILYVGAMTVTKNLPRLIKAFEVVSKQHDDVRLLMVGDGPKREEAEALTAQLGLQDKAQFVGAVHEGVSAYFSLGDLLVTPGTGGLVVSEAMTHGLPVISAIGDGSEIDLIENGVNGFLISSEGVDELVERIRWCLDHPDELREMGLRSREVIDETHNIQAYVNEMLAGISQAYRLCNKKSKERPVDVQQS